MANYDSTILAIDPGSITMGYALIAIKNKKPTLLEMGVLRLGTYKDIYIRLAKIHTRVGSLISEFKPDSFAIEAPFFGKNVQSMLKLGRAQGVAIAAAMQASLSVTEYSPRKVKQAVTGNGNANKEQVWRMLKDVLKLTEDQPQFLDASDALAVALCHFYETSSPLAGLKKGKNGWADFIAQNPDRIVKK
ncbi:crossover junction endodeoxyribonuclease RuvC [Rhizosphaericola mali]|uniref:Crossover junction endodeoxyribonuclease RuvC n=1 Tax=Rhizosphaericola mali TaxID=2545455 RepID=A0A5P2GAA2_9BACT|nr:crossover junction endodeoxyribonuclease RuvC [Rhizosphaericola mali]QES90113.1 crossover junction endodeoxyribonuclease RuvC [Rhizosphaericola mali]